MRIVIIEDDSNKLKQLAAFVHERFPLAEVAERRSYQSGLKEAIESGPELVLLDMTLPTYDIGGGEQGGRTRPFAGREILAGLKRRKISTRVVIVTQFERFGEGIYARTLPELKRELSEMFGEIYIGTVFYQPAESGWKEELIDLLDDLASNGAL